MSKDKQDDIIVIDFMEPNHIKEAGHAHMYRSYKNYNHSVGLSCCFRQPNATHSHCQYLHGYALRVEIEFGAAVLDNKNWVQDFGGLKALKAWLESTFDHKTLVAQDDPKKVIFREMHTAGLIQMVVVPAVGIEAFARLVYESAVLMFEKDHVEVNRVRIWEHDGNSAEYGVI